MMSVLASCMMRVLVNPQCIVNRPLHIPAMQAHIYVSKHMIKVHACEVNYLTDTSAPIVSELPQTYYDDDCGGPLRSWLGGGVGMGEGTFLLELTNV